QARLGIGEFVLYDRDRDRAETIARIGRAIVRRLGAEFRVETIAAVEVEARARDERIAIECGLAGQEPTGPGGVAMALRTVPVVLEQARAIAAVAPDAWFISFTNPAGLIAQAIALHTRLRAVGICDTPIELFHRIAWALGAPYEEMAFEYAGLNHLGWVR